MASTLKPNPQSERQRLFVLVHGEIVRGVFLSFEAAESFADENGLSLDRLLEFTTRSTHPDHLHLMSGKFSGEEDWRFLGEWSQANLPADTDPEAVRLEHFLIRNNHVEHFRSCEFSWEPGLLREVQPMAENPKPASRKRKSMSEPTPIHRRKLQEEDASKPAPIPSFQPMGQPPTTRDFSPPQTKESGISKTQAEPAWEPPEETLPEADANVRLSLMPVSLVLALLIFFGGWTWGLSRLLYPAPGPAEVVSSIGALKDAKTLAIDPDMLFFQMPVETVHQNRWVRNLGLDPIPYDQTVVLPQYHGLATWDASSDSTAGEPYAWSQVEAWWEPRRAEIAYGFYREWPDGSQLLLDLEGNRLSGWIRTDHLRELFQ
jgi:hypothetical protein